MGRIRDPLELMGASVALTGEQGSAPLTVAGGGLHAIEYELPVASAQVKSCVLLAALFADGRTRVMEKAPTRNHTELLLAALGADITCDGLEISIQGYGEAGPRFAASDWTVPGDFSSAAFWIAAAAMREGAELTVENVGLNPARTAFIDSLARMGAEITVTERTGSTAASTWERIGDVHVKGVGLHGIEVGGSDIPNMIDELPLLAFTAALASGKTVIRDAGELRVKESNRIASTVDGLLRMGVRAEETSDGMIIFGADSIKGGVTLESYGDHRIVMGLSVLALAADKPVVINDVQCVDTSYPQFWDDLDKVRM
jgi:3-phosphoshikimate 1-carboxyvinyltransferase